MNRMDIEDEISDLRVKLKENLQLFFDTAILDITITRGQMQNLSKEFDIPLNAQFRSNLKAKFVELIFNLQKQQWIVKCLRYPPTNMQELLNTSFFPSEGLPVLERHPPLAEFIQLVNLKINEFYQVQKKLISFLTKQQSQLEQNEKKQIEKRKVQSLPQNVLQKQTQEQKEQKRKKSDSIIEISEDEVNQFYEDQKNKKNINARRKQRQNITAAFRKNLKAEIDLEKLSNYREPSEEEQKCIFCLCYKLSLRKVNGQMIRCIECGHYFHTQCLQMENKIPIVYACAECTITRLDHLRPIQRAQLIPQYVSLKENYFKIYDLEPIPIKDSDQYEMRCLKIDGESQEIAWPDCGELKLNGILALQFIPLGVNSSLKKRQDESQPLNLVTNYRNQIKFQQGLPTREQMKQFRIKLGQTFLVAIFKVSDINPKELVQKIKLDYDNWMGIEQCKQMIKLSIMSNKSENFAIEKIKISLNDTLNMTLIETPVRGTFCTHIQCFSLENMSTMMKNMSLRKWKCPICKSLILNFVVDAYQLCIISLIKQHNLQIDEISFNSEAKIEPEKIEEIYNQHCLTIFPDFMYSNKNRSIAMEILSQRILGLTNVFGSLQEDEEDIDSAKIEQEQQLPDTVPPFTKEGTKDQPIYLD